MKRIWPRNAWGAPRFLPVITRKLTRRYHAAVAQSITEGWDRGLALLAQRGVFMRSPTSRMNEMARARVALAEATRRLMFVSNDPHTPDRDELTQATLEASKAHLRAVRWIMDHPVDVPPEEG